MKLIMPAKQIKDFDYAAMTNTHSLRGLVTNAAHRLDAEIIECDYSKFSEFAFVSEAYRIALYHAMYADDIEDVKAYLARCVEVFEGKCPEMEFVDGEFPDYVRAGFDRLLGKMNEKLKENGVSGAFGNPSATLYDAKSGTPTLH